MSVCIPYDDYDDDTDCTAMYELRMAAIEQQKIDFADYIINEINDFQNQLAKGSVPPRNDGSGHVFFGDSQGEYESPLGFTKTDRGDVYIHKRNKVEYSKINEPETFEYLKSIFLYKLEKENVSRLINFLKGKEKVVFLP